MRTIYLDILVIINLSVNYILILTVKRILHSDTKTARIFIGALVGAVFSLHILIPSFSILFDILLRIICLFTITLATFGYKSLKYFIKYSAALLLVSCSLGGVLFAIISIFNLQEIVYHNGIVYFNISPIFLIAATTVTYIVICLLRRILSKQYPDDLVYDILIKLNGNEVLLKGIVDTGNSLCDPFDNTPALITNYSKIDPIIPNDIKECLRKNDLSVLTVNAPYSTIIRILPFNTITGAGVIPAIVIDDAIYYKGKQRIPGTKPIVAINQTTIFNDEYDALINPDLIQFN